MYIYIHIYIKIAWKKQKSILMPLYPMFNADSKDIVILWHLAWAIWGLGCRVLVVLWELKSLGSGI